VADETKPAPAKPTTAPAPAAKVAEPAHKADPEAPPTPEVIRAKKVDHDKLIADAMEAEREANPLQPGSKVNYGIFGDNPQRFLVLHEGVGRFGAGEEVTWRDLIQWNAKPMGGGSVPDMESPNVTQTKANVDRLIGLGAIQPIREYA
jgi:hypothetical protein